MAPKTTLSTQSNTFRTPMAAETGFTRLRQPVLASLGAHALLGAVVLLAGMWQGGWQRPDALRMQKDPGVDVKIIVEEIPQPKSKLLPQPKPQPEPKPEPKPKPKPSPKLQQVPKIPLDMVKAAVSRTSSATSLLQSPPAPRMKPVIPPAPVIGNAAPVPAPFPRGDSGFIVKKMDSNVVGALTYGPASGGDKAPLTQSERDFLLVQILRYFRPNVSMSARNEASIMGSVVVQKDGMLAPPFNANMPWNPQAAIPQYAQAQRTGNIFVQRALKSFYLALRIAQPLKLPPGTKGKWPRRISVSFRLKDVLAY